MMEVSDNFRNFLQVYTDGSISNNGPGIGIYLSETEEKFSKRLSSYASIKLCELLIIDYY